MVIDGDGAIELKQDGGAFDKVEIVLTFPRDV